MTNPYRAEPDAVGIPVFSWRAAEDTVNHVRPIDTIAPRIAHLLMEPGFDRRPPRVDYHNGAVVIAGAVAHFGLPLRNQVNTIRIECDGPWVITLRETDSFGEVLVYLDPTAGAAAAYSVTIDRTMKGGVSYPSPRPEEQMARRIGRFSFEPVARGPHEIVLTAVEEDITIAVDGAPLIAFRDPDVAAGCVGIASAEGVRVVSFDQVELVTEAESRARDEFVRNMTEFCRQLDSEHDAEVARANSVETAGDRLTWRYPETGARLELAAVEGGVYAEGYAGLYGDARMFRGLFAWPLVTDTSGDVYRPAAARRPALSGDELSFGIEIPLESASGQTGTISVTARLTLNALWFCTARMDGVDVSDAALAFQLDREFEPLWEVAGIAGEPARMAYGPSALVTDGSTQDPSRKGFGLGCPADPDGLGGSIICTDGVVGHVWKALSGQDTKMELCAVGDSPALVLRSHRFEFRWATMWMPYHRLNLTGYKKRMLHFIRHPETPSSEYRERPSRCEYPTDDELERYAANGVKAMVWHHTWASNNYRRRDGFVVNDSEMRRAMRRAHELGMDVITYIGIVPGRHPALRYEDLSTRMFYDKNWDLQDFTFYSVAGRISEFLPYMTDLWRREYGLDGFYTDGGLALLDWGYTGMSEETCGMSLEELNDRLYSRVVRVLRRGNAGFGLENWGGAPIHLTGPYYDCRMIGETFQERPPESYRDGYNPLLTAAPFKMYGMDLVARNRHNIAMAAVCMTDIQICSGNYAWGCWPDAPSDWANLRPFWAILDGIDWDSLTDARPWWAQKLVEGDGFLAGYYATPRRVVFFVANREQEPRLVAARIRRDHLPEAVRSGRLRQIYPEQGDWRPLDDGVLEMNLPGLRFGPLGFEIAAD